MSKLREIHQSFKEWSPNVAGRWYAMITLLTYLPLLGGLIYSVIWARNVEPPLPMWNIVIIFGGALLFLIISFLAFNRVRVERDNLKLELKNKESEITKNLPNPDLTLGAKVNSISTYGYYDRLIVNDIIIHTEGDKKVNFNIVLNPIRPVVLDDLTIELWGVKYPIHDFDESPLALPLFPMLYREVTHFKVYTDIPKDFAINAKDVIIYALVNGIEYPSEPFTINFEETK